ncbi:cytochrome P450 [Nocardia sp. NBC_01009]|uniref:cytochrome P450 n=1 Tax=Nocardia sp. NBC_01009 TaxID=2975996 RepID=UPI003870D5FA|nr:cytochrome P450 [Nocardia sp. NBC_01009]
MTLYSGEFAADPHGAYRDMRRHHGSLVPVEVAPGVPATLVIGYREALHVLGDPRHFPADPRVWQSTVPADCPVLSMMEWQPNASRTAGEEHARYRRANTDSLDKIDLYALRGAVERTAAALIDSFCESGSADLLSQYAVPLTAQVLNDLLGFSQEAGEEAFAALVTLRNADDAASAEAGHRMFTSAMLEVISAKREAPATDVTSWLLEHPSALDEAEMVQQMAMLYVTGTEPTSNLIVNTLLLMATDDRFGSELLAGALSTRDAIDEVLFTDPPLANSCFSYPRQPQILGDVLLPMHEPVVISLAACNNDPAAVNGDRTGNRSHLAWGAGPHACPAKSLAMVIVQEALDQLLDALPEIRLAVPAEQLQWRQGGFHRALETLPVIFPPSPPLPNGARVTVGIGNE